MMKGDPQVIDALNRALTVKLTAINQYFCQAKMCKNWGYMRLYKKQWEESMGEMKHADKLIDRILFLEGVPEIARYDVIRVGTNVKEQFENDLKLEINAVAMYNASIKIARDEGDNASRELFERLLKDEEMHVDWLEAQMHQIEELSYERYLSQQIREEK